MNKLLINGCIQSDLPKVLHCLYNKADVNYIQSNYTPLLWACQGNDTDIVKLLIERGANINIQNEKGLTGLSIACALGKTDVVNILLENRANKEIRDEDSWTALHTTCSCINDRSDVCRTLLENNSDINSKTEDDWTALHFACHSEQPFTVKLLILEKADPNTLNQEGKIPIELTTKQEVKDAYEKALEELASRTTKRAKASN